MAENPNSNDSTQNDKRRKTPLPQSDVPSFPLAQAERVGRAIVDHLAKQPSSPLQVAAAMGIKPTTGDFRSLTGASIAFGLTEGGYNADQIRLTDLGRRLFSPTQEGDDHIATREAVLRPRVNKLFLERYNGSKWPREDIARNVLEEMGVPSAQTERALARIREDAEAAGFIIEINGDSFVQLSGVPAPRPSAPVSVNQHELSPEASHMVTPPAIRPAIAAEAPTASPHPPSAPEPENRRVFITHGKDTAIVQQIKEILRFGEFEPVVASETQTSAKPVPDKVMDDMRSCAAGIVHVGSEMKLLDTEGNEHQMLNPNVLIEIGAAMALYGRRFILLVERGTTLPSNLQGLYEVRYEGTGLDHEATMNLLKAFNSFKESKDDGQAA